MVTVVASGVGAGAGDREGKEAYISLTLLCYLNLSSCEDKFYIYIYMNHVKSSLDVKNVLSQKDKKQVVCILEAP